MKNISKNKEYESLLKDITIPGNDMLAFYIDETSLNQISQTKYNCASIYVNSKFKKDISQSVFDEMSITMGTYLKKSNNLKVLLKEVEQNSLKK